MFPFDPFCNFLDPVFVSLLSSPPQPKILFIMGNLMTTRKFVQMSGHRLPDVAYQLVAQFTFRGLPLCQAMTIARLLVQQEHEYAYSFTLITDFFALIMVMTEAALPLENQTDCFSIEEVKTGEVASRVIFKSLQGHQPVESMAQTISCASQVMKLGVRPKSVLEVIEKALDEGVIGHELYPFIGRHLGSNLGKKLRVKCVCAGIHLNKALNPCP